MIPTPVKAENWREILELAVASGAVPEGLAGTLEDALGLLAGLSGSSKTLDIPLDFRNGRMLLGHPGGGLRGVPDRQSDQRESQLVRLRQCKKSPLRPHRYRIFSSTKDDFRSRSQFFLNFQFTAVFDQSVVVGRDNHSKE